MSWLATGGELIAGIVLLVLWWIVTGILARRQLALTNFHLTVTTPVFLLWGVLAVLLVLRGLTLL